ncbi:MAG: HAMP domain-containing protein [Oligoflexia bacterium]|nr:HAMP domain-containing protein [Oligoflexia bacterium]
MKPKFSIRYKILSVVTALLMAAIAMYLALAMRIFKMDKQELVFDLNSSVVSTVSTEISSQLRGVSDKLRLFTLLHVDSTDARRSLVREIFENDPLLARIELYEAHVSSGDYKLVSKIADKSFLDSYGQSEDFFESTLPKVRNIPFQSIQSESFKVWNATIKDGPPVFAVGLSMIQDGKSGVPEKMLAAVAYVKLDGLLKTLTASRVTETFVVDSEGRTLIHPNLNKILERTDYSGAPILKEFRSNKISKGVMEFDFGGKSLLGAYASVGFGNLGVISQVPSEKAFAAVQQLVTRSILFASIVVTLTFIATVFFSRTLTQPLFKLMGAMQKVSQGDLSAALQVKSHDEIAVLSQAFNKMTIDLKTSRDQIEEINRELENKVADRTRKLEMQNRAVKEAQEALLRTTRLASVGEIAGRTAHEVLNPLTSLMTRVQKVQKRLNEEVNGHKNLLGEILSAWKDDVKQKGMEGFLKSLEEKSSVDPKLTLLEEDLQNINQVFQHWDSDLGTLEKDTQFVLQQANRIERILRQMRSLSAVSGNRVRHDLNQVLHDSVNIVADLFSKAKIEIKEKYHGEPLWVMIDRDEMIQVLTNVLRNALHAVIDAKKAPKEGYVQISSGISGAKVCVDITDNGSGISKENQGKLFESQFSTKSPELGTGLGLSISRRFVRAFHGDLYLSSSEPGQGTTFRIEIPMVAEAKKDEAAA